MCLTPSFSRPRERSQKNEPNVIAGRLERRVRPAGSETMPGIHGFAFYSFGAIWFRLNYVRIYTDNYVTMKAHAAPLDAVQQHAKAFWPPRLECAAPVPTLEVCAWKYPEVRRTGTATTPRYCEQRQWKIHSHWLFALLCPTSFVGQMPANRSETVPSPYPRSTSALSLARNSVGRLSNLALA